MIVSFSLRQLTHRYSDDTIVPTKSQEVIQGGAKMSIGMKRIIILLVIIAIGFVLGRLAVRAVMNLMLGGTLFGGNFL